MPIFRKKHKLDNESLKRGVGLVTVTDPNSVVSEQFRTIRTNIQFSSTDKKLQSIVVTSAEPSEGKSTISSNLAVVCAKQNQKVVLVDADLRRPTVHRTFKLLNAAGLSSYLTNNAVYEEVVQSTSIPNLSIISSGPVPPNPAELLNSANVNSLLERLKSEFDMIIIDAPPVNTVTDAQLLSSKADGVILVVPQGIAEKGSVAHAVEQLKTVHAKLLGTVMNRFKADKAPGYYGGYYGGDYGGYYGVDDKK
ncbi:exopolysaccharide biosynthesis protein [Pediococcus damnosus LMG 28219]|uniref:CpsD/CapB family tyrosine-protein kinase n=1 Tax=Pediococcus damnosus TaxID=51663 RepID=UPI00061E8BF8|nr:CpsD/CapB family tyrosine-protein kinase [Pediococcus damnosus]KJU73430.1 exopolysaccharide biosynthesis protein [Pediococcus damnosus LMG 28219]